MARNPNWHETWLTYLPYNFRIGFVSWFYIKNFQTFLEVKIEINLDDLKPCQVQWVLKNLLLGCPKDEHFSYFHSSCQLGLTVIIWMSHWRHTMVDGTRFWISCQWLAFLIILSRWQLIQNLAPSCVVNVTSELLTSHHL